MVNKVILLGNLGKDPIINKTKDGKSIASFSIATSESRKDKDGNKQEKTEWHNIVIFGKLAEIVEKYVKKGSKVYLEGKISYETYEKEGEKKYTTKIIADTMTMLSSANGSESKESSTQSTQSTNEASNEATIPAPTDEENLPF